MLSKVNVGDHIRMHLKNDNFLATFTPCFSLSSIMGFSKPSSLCWVIWRRKLFPRDLIKWRSLCSTNSSLGFWKCLVLSAPRGIHRMFWVHLRLGRWECIVHEGDIAWKILHYVLQRMAEHAQKYATFQLATERVITHLLKRRRGQCKKCTFAL